MHNAYRGGTPDVWYSGPGGDLWVEYKWVSRLSTRRAPALSALQLDWLTKRAAEGRRVLVIEGYPKGAAVYEGSASWTGGGPTRLITAEAAAALIHGLCV